MTDKGYTVIEGPDGVVIKKPEASSSVPGFDRAWKEAMASLSETDFADSHTYVGALSDKVAKVFLRDAPAGKYDSIAKMYAAGEINGAGVISMVVKANFEEGYLNKKPISDTSTSDKSFVENERKVSDTIERVKNSLDMNAIKEDVQRMIKEILSTFMSYDDYFENIRQMPSNEVVGHLL
jgi:hypothetical protein